MRTVVKPGLDAAQGRQLVVFADAASAQEAMRQLRAERRACQQEVAGPFTTTWGARGETTFVGEQLDLGDESFWTARRDLILSDPTGTYCEGMELHYSSLVLVVLDRNVLYLADEYAFSPEMRADEVEQITAEWQLTRDLYAALVR